MAKVLLLDGNSLTYRAFFALPTDMATASGQVTNAVFGFTSMLLNLIKDQNPDGIVVAFDRPEPTFRHEMLPEYKAQRDPTPELLIQQFELVREVLAALKVPAVDLVGFEADDVLATIATEVAEAGDEAIIVTGDRDIYQMVRDPLIKVLYNRRGVSDYSLYDEAGIAERTGVTPDLYPQYAALRGDPSDNLPGVPGVGEKTAAKLINAYGGLDGIFEHADEQTPKLRQNLIEFEDRARRNVDAMVLRKDAPVDFDRSSSDWGVVDVKEVQRLFELLEFNSLYERLSDILDDALPTLDSETAVLEAELIHATSPEECIAALIPMKEQSQPLSLGWIADDDGSLIALAVLQNVETAEVLVIEHALLEDNDVIAALSSFTAYGGIGFDAHNAKELTRGLRQLGLVEEGLRVDTAIAAYLLDPTGGRYVLDDLLMRYCREELVRSETANAGQLDLGGGGDNLFLDIARDALAVSRLAPTMLKLIDERSMTWLYEELERPLISVLSRMEDIGVGVDVKELTRMRDHLVSEVQRLETAIHGLAGREFNVNSTKQLREVLFDELELTPQKKTKTGYSTDAASLEKIRDQHEVVGVLLEYREVEKLRSTYGQGLLEVTDEDDRIRATFNQTVARTGRLSSEDPNLHNIPVRTPLGREFRKAFVPQSGYDFLVADYNQIELRVIAHLAEDPGLIEAFETGQDIHNTTAASIFGVDLEKVNFEQRSRAKMVSYGLAYGMEAYGLGQRLGIGTSEASEILDSYFEAFPAVRSFMDDVVNKTKEVGYTETIFGRRRPIPDLVAPNFRVRQAAERQAMNAPIQGLAADIFKIALVGIDRSLTEMKAQSRLVLQVHDEVILEVHPDEHQDVQQMTVEQMSGAADLRVPLEVNLATGPTWAQAKA
ncbi:MAG: DNA polymerase I [Acidimicrobiales bacterium]|nr:DNA polymerase I [Acidimicrobiales bacterium]MDP6901938.1 DNA polymerase I [Acidimicrobiales bacterium]HJL98324.1 DNA polymerase I [Acidimicrobiales bacterium]